jgi:hypothetical protein
MRKIGNGLSTSFWNVKWVGDGSLADVFPRLFLLSNHKENNVRDFFENGEWSFMWRRNLFRWEEDLVLNLKLLLEPVSFTMEEDSWRWAAGEEGEFSVKSSYLSLVEELSAIEEGVGGLVNVLGQIWESPAPSKVIAFSWQLLLDRIPTRENLDFQGCLPQGMPWECLGCVEGRKFYSPFSPLSKCHVGMGRGIQVARNLYCHPPLSLFPI